MIGIPAGFAILVLTMQSPAPPVQDWSRVVALRTGDRVVVTAGGSGALEAIFADATGDRMRVLALGSPAVADAVRTLLRASFTPAELATALDGRQLAAADVTFGPQGLMSRGSVIATTTNVVREIARHDVDEVRRLSSSGRRAPASAGLALIVAGTGVIVLNAIGLSSGTTIPAGGARDGYLGAPGVVIGGALVVTGGVLLGRAHARPVIYRRTP